MAGNAKRVYFYCRNNPNAYQDDVVVLAEGLRELGVPVYGNCDYWLRSVDRNDWLVRHDPAVEHYDCDIVVVSYGWSRWIDSDFRVYESPLPEGIFSDGRGYRTAYLDLEDGYLTCGFKREYLEFDAVFRAKYNFRCYHPPNHFPWALALSGRMLECTLDAAPWEERRRDLLLNFNASHPYLHPARTLMERQFTPLASRQYEINRERDDLSIRPAREWDRLMWEQTQHRHSRNYYDRLRSSQAVAAFCGEMVPPAPFFPPYLVGGNKAKVLRILYNAMEALDRRPPRLIQWDSWRFWEALAAGCLVFNFDLPYYGVRMPVMPENFVHYVGVRTDNIGESFERLQDDRNLAQVIAKNGRDWAIEHYSPSSVARRFLDRLLPQSR